MWQRERLQGEVLDSLRGYWLKQLQGMPTLELPTDRPRPAVRTTSGDECRRRLPRPTREAISQIGRQEGATPFMILIAAFQTLLHRYSGQDEFPVGTPVAGRLRPETESLIGCFINTLVLRANLSGDPSFRQLLGRVRRTALEAFDHQEMPFERLVEDLKPPRDLSWHPVFQVMFILQNAPEEEQDLSDFELSDVKGGGLGGQAAEFDLLLAAEEGGEGIDLSLTYRTDLFDGATAARMLEHFESLLEQMLADPDRPISQLPPLAEAAESDGEPPLATTVFPALFERQAARTPNASAVQCEDQCLSYQELNQRANRLARRLGEAGVRPQELVGLYTETQRQHDRRAARHSQGRRRLRAAGHPCARPAVGGDC